ncbi:Hypothetical protein R9X50_00136400 [Acrodontium crateriforme]|uniref:Nitrogen regulatory protein areA GATA-like domain-containing protein n=1 Tax=Acrodontium crateriforme TaxID=150365 RepID=A0AAQ3RA07_9PEZI|nr:Hypothetical protein R9X50_00136400 [Acrodontium crateriforme]
MPFKPEHSLLRVEVPALHTVDTSSVESLMGMWSLFSKTSHAMEDGRRLENLSWRLWNRETFCCAPQSPSHARSTHKPRYSHPMKTSTNDISVPELSTSLDSASSDDLEHTETSSPHIQRTRPQFCRDESVVNLSRGREKHITPIDLQNIVMSIQETKTIEPIEISLPTPAAKPIDPPFAPATALDMSTSEKPAQPLDDDAKAATADSKGTPPPTQPLPVDRSKLESSASTVDSNDLKDSKTSASDSFSSEDNSTTEMSTHSIVRGFVPGGAPSSYRSQTNLAAQPTPILKTSPLYVQQPQKKKGPMFTIGTSSGEEESSLESHMLDSQLARSLRGPGGSGSSMNSKKQTSFKDEVSIAKASEQSPVFESDDEDDELASESAIDDEDDSSDWEDSDEASGPSSVNERELFQRVDSRPNLTSRQSLLTTLMHEPDRARALQSAASRSSPALRRSRTTTPSGPSVATSPSPDRRAHLQPPGQDVLRSKPIIMTTSNTHEQLALSPRTTRRNMLSTELTESLRKNLLWERQHRSTGNLAALKRRHTAHTDMKNLKQHPEPAPMLSQKTRGNFNNEYFNAGLQEYHDKGW